ncbi:glycoside hydrolase domain-containing protein [Actinomadura sp. NPDC048394]|uniref:glycoside hydrolase domain-containing protein n=1 Tax=Actinomadura sp. NPDC048394 TaxID=3158223 RepID=UPI0033C7BFCF
MFGVDYAWGRPGAAALQRAGAKFVCRYLSPDTTGKNLDAGEARELGAAGIAIVVVWESTAARARAGRDAGAVDARTAAAQAAACGMPPDRPIYFAVDFDAAPADQSPINAYLRGAASVLGVARVGIYGGYWPVSRALDAGLARWAWQTYAWSGGRWDARAQLQQYSNDHVINGVGVDYNRSTSPDFGQWLAGSPAAPNWTENLVHSLPIVSPGATGEDVQSVQGLLVARSHSEVVVDGRFGDVTEAAVKAVQKWGGVTADGIVGPQTWPVLLRVQ